MSPLVAILEPADVWKVVVIAAVIAYLVTWILTLGGAKSRDLQRLERRVSVLKQQLDHLVAHAGIPLPPAPSSGFPPEVERLAREPYGKIAAIKRLREQNPGIGLAEAKARIDEFLENQS